MMNKIFAFIIACFGIIYSSQSMVYAKSMAPVTLEYSVPKSVEPGTRVTMKIRFIARADLQRLTVSAAPYDGLTLISGGDQVEFNHLQQGQDHEIEVTLKLDDDVGHLAVYVKTINAQGQIQHKNIAIRYGASGESGLKKEKAEVTVTLTGEKQIHMPSQDR